MSGVQIQNAYERLLPYLFKNQSLKQALEINVIAASSQQLHNLTIAGKNIPVYAYFRTNSFGEKAPFVTGTHSSTDYVFENPIQDMVQALNKIQPENSIYMPPCTNIVRDQY